jgi:hypothetical protein
MKVRKLLDGELVEAGDVLRHNSFMGKKWFKFVRVTPKFAVVKWNENSEGKFKRVVSEFGMRPCGSRDIWAQTEYSAWRPVKEKKEDGQ